MARGRNRLVAAIAALVLLRLLVALAPAEPRLFGTPFGLVLELVIVGVSTLNLWFAVRTLLPEGVVPERSVSASTEERQ